jgi:hypothetical protein
VQKIRYLNLERSRTEQEEKRQNIEENKKVEDVFKHGYAYGNEINLAFVALARAAGFESAPIMVTSRSTNFFEPRLPLFSQLDSMLVWARAGGKDYFLDPATKFCPFDLLPWEESASEGIVVTNKTYHFEQNARIKPDKLLSTPRPTSDAAVIERVAALELSPDGSVSGSVAIIFVGQEALARRSSAHNMDEATRKKSLEEEIKEWLPPAATVELKDPVNWEESDQPLRAAFSLKLPEFATTTGRRLLFRAGLFEASVKSFEQGTRKHDIYFPYPYQQKDDVTWTIPAGYKLGNLPEKRNLKTIYGTYDLSADAGENRVRFKRHFTSESLYIPVAQYWAIRAHFNQARQWDEGQMVLESTGASDAND